MYAHYLETGEFLATIESTCAPCREDLCFATLTKGDGSPVLSRLDPNALAVVLLRHKDVPERKREHLVRGGKVVVTLRLPNKSSSTFDYMGKVVAYPYPVPEDDAE